MKRLTRGLGAILLISLGTTPVAAQPTRALYPRTLLINFDPIIESRQSQRLHTVAGWSDPTTLTGGYISDVAGSSHGLVNYRLGRIINADVWPVKEDGFRYTDESYLNGLSGGGWHTPDLSDYKAKVRDYDLARKVDSGEIEEVLDHSGPYFGGYETRMIGRGGYWCNSPPLQRVACSRIFVISVFNYERGVGEMLEDLGHRTESILRYVYGSWSAQETHTWNRFTLYDKVLPGKAACGNVHFAPNSDSDYDWGNVRYVDSTADYWLNVFPAGYPTEINNYKRSMNRTEWGNGDIRLHHVWWFTRIPHAPGSITEYGMTRLNNWWAYIQDFNSHPESNGDFARGGTPPPAQPYTGSTLAVTSNGYDDWQPRLNAAGRVVWHGSDGNDFEIWSANTDGSRLTRLTDNAFHDEDPQINASGRVVWQGFDGRDYEIFSANADGSGFVQITNNNTDDRHPQVNDNGTVVWDSFDGQDYEIFSAKVDGTSIVRITNNSAASGYPREDVWPQINNQGRVVWSGYDGSNWEIFSANADGSDLVNVSNNTYENEYPRINNAGRVVWHAWHTNTNSEIYSANATGGYLVRLTTNTYEDWYPDVNDSGVVVWMGRANSSDWEILSANATGGSLPAVTNNSSHDQYPRIDNTGRVVWQGFDGTDFEIYAWRDGSVVQVTQNAYDDRWPQINSLGEIVWHADAAPSPTAPTSEIRAAYRVPRVPGDYDLDGDVDQEDFGHFQACITGDLTPPPAGCEDVNFNGDSHVDSLDFDVFWNCWGGPNLPPKPGCDV